MKFSSVLLSEDSSARPYQMCGQILTFPEKKDLMHKWWPHPTKSAADQRTGRPPQVNPTRLKKKKKVFTMAPLNHMHEGHCSYFTILKMAAVSSTIILDPSRIWTPFADLDFPTKFSFWAPFVSYLVTNSICKLFFDVLFNHNTTFLNKGREKTAISFQFCRIYYSESYSIRKN